MHDNNHHKLVVPLKSVTLLVYTEYDKTTLNSCFVSFFGSHWFQFITVLVLVTLLCCSPRSSSCCGLHPGKRPGHCGENCRAGRFFGFDWMAMSEASSLWGSKHIDDIRWHRYWYGEATIDDFPWVWWQVSVSEDVHVLDKELLSQEIKEILRRGRKQRGRQCTPVWDRHIFLAWPRNLLLCFFWIQSWNHAIFSLKGWFLYDGDGSKAGWVSSTPWTTGGFVTDTGNEGHLSLVLRACFCCQPGFWTLCFFDRCVSVLGYSTGSYCDHACLLHDLVGDQKIEKHDRRHRVRTMPVALAKNW